MVLEPFTERAEGGPAVHPYLCPSRLETHPTRPYLVRSDRVRADDEGCPSCPENPSYSKLVLLWT